MHGKNGEPSAPYFFFLRGENKLECKSQLIALNPFLSCFSLCACVCSHDHVGAYCMPPNMDFSVCIIKEILTFIVCISGCSKLPTSLKRYGFCLVHSMPAYFSFALYRGTQESKPCKIYAAAAVVTPLMPIWGYIN